MRKRMGNESGQDVTEWSRCLPSSWVEALEHSRRFLLPETWMGQTVLFTMCFHHSDLLLSMAPHYIYIRLNIPVHRKKRYPSTPHSTLPHTTPTPTPTSTSNHSINQTNHHRHHHHHHQPPSLPRPHHLLSHPISTAKGNFNPMISPLH